MIKRMLIRVKFTNAALCCVVFKDGEVTDIYSLTSVKMAASFVRRPFGHS